jgi:FkbM family methyltransferase
MDFKMANKAYEWKVVSVFKKECNKADLVLDIGSNNGIYGIMAAKQGIKTYAFEPIIDNYDALLKNIELNNLNDKITAFDFALGDSPKNAIFNFNTFNTGSASINKLNVCSEEREVKIVVFDELKIHELKTAKNILIKMDVEGMEIPVIKGLKNLLKSNLNLVFIVETKHTSKKKIITELSKYANFKFKRIDAFNMLAIKKSN